MIIFLFVGLFVSRITEILLVGSSKKKKKKKDGSWSILDPIKF